MIGVELAPEYPVSELAEYGVAAERAGLDTVFLSHHYNNRDQFSALAAIAAATEDVDLGPGVANPYETHPVTLASRMATVDEYADGRGVFGVGPGDARTLSNLGIERDRPLRRVLETFRVARDLWAGESVTHDGTFEAEGARLNYAPGPVPVYVGAQGPHMTRMAAKHADGVLFNGAHPRDYEWARERVAEGLADRPDEHGEFDFAAYAPVSVARGAEQARAAARVPVAFVVGSAEDPLLDRHGVDREAASAVGEAVAAGEFSTAADRVTDRMLSAFAIAGAPADVEEQVDAVLEYADSFVAASPLGPDPETAIPLTGAVLSTVRR
ncbi:MAG: 5,10-methylenetetrahydromethanopterin reductase [Haloarculaceae archaeon]